MATVMTLAGGGDYTVPNLVINVFIAVGTIAAAVVAAWLGLQAQRASRVQAREARLKNNRQVIGVYKTAGEGGGPTVEVINAGPEVITRVVVEVHHRPTVQGTDVLPLVWEWADPVLAEHPTVDYLLPGGRVDLAGSFRPRTESGADPVDGPAPVSVETQAVDLGLIWEDSYGQVWNKRGGDEAFPTGWAAPFRDLRNFRPRYLWPAHYPPLAPSRPLIARLRDRLRVVWYTWRPWFRQHVWNRLRNRKSD